MAEVVLNEDVAHWTREIDLYERTFEQWTKRGKKLQKRYKDVRSPREETSTRFNILWSNVQTRLPALYARDPKPEVERRFKDRDPVGRCVAEILERSLDYTIQHCNPFGRLMRQAVLDYELPGRGTVWVRYVPHFHKVELLEPDDEPDNEEVKAEGVQETNDAEDEENEEISYEETLIDYVYWEDYGHTWARTEDEVRAKWRRVYLDRHELSERFVKKGGLSQSDVDSVPLEWSPKGQKDDKIKLEQKKAIVYEIWDKLEREVIWIVKNFAKPLDKLDDPLKLDGFFPTPAPLYANLCSDELIPVPNFVFYQDQAAEIDEITSRIASISKALKVAGVRDTSAEGLDRLLAEGTENQLVPIDGWIALKEKGGLAGVMELLPLKEIAEALGYLREQRQMMVDDVYQITGLSDIIRGLSDPNETATAQQIKGQFSVLRISAAQTEVQRFARDVIRIAAEIIAGYDLETLKKISGVKLLTEQEKAALRAQLQPPMPLMPGPGANPGPAPAAPPVQPGSSGGGGPPPGPGAPVPPAGGTPGVDPEKQRLLNEPSWEEVGKLLKNPVLREFRIDIETDSTIRMDEEAEKSSRMEFMTAASQLITEAASVPKEMIPAVGELFLFAVRGFKVARNLERTFEDALEQLKHAPPKPDPEMMKVQAKAQSDMQIAQAKSQADMQVENNKQQMQAKENALKNQFEDARAQRELAANNQHAAQLEQLKQGFEAQRVALELASQERIAAQKNATDMQIAQMNADHERQMALMTQTHEANMTAATQGHEKAMAVHQSESAKDGERVKGEESRKTESLKGQHAKDIEGVRGANAEKVAKVKPKAEADAKAEGEKDAKAPAVAAIEKLTEAIKEARKPRKAVYDKAGKLEGLN
jgi:hypothetical protein